jgi:hypothetical protein
MESRTACCASFLAPAKSVGAPLFDRFSLPASMRKNPCSRFDKFNHVKYTKTLSVRNPRTRKFTSSLRLQQTPCRNFEPGRRASFQSAPDSIRPPLKEACCKRPSNDACAIWAPIRFDHRRRQMCRTSLRTERCTVPAQGMHRTCAKKKPDDSSSGFGIQMEQTRNQSQFSAPPV